MKNLGIAINLGIDARVSQGKLYVNFQFAERIEHSTHM